METNSLTKNKITKEKTKLINNRFGQFSIRLDKIINFKNGIIGIPELKKFVLTKFPNQLFDKFQILQSLNDEKMAFIVLPGVYLNDKNDAPESESLSSTSGFSIFMSWLKKFRK